SFISSNTILFFLDLIKSRNLSSIDAILANSQKAAKTSETNTKASETAATNSAKASAASQMAAKASEDAAREYASQAAEPYKYVL
ncbi:hypothetical protein O5254_27390, partial [Escherichia coli]|nr:hypothetical protein [Escherichia coli]